MKKILSMLGLALILVGCGSEWVETECQLKKDDEVRKLNIVYTKDKKLISFTLKSTYIVDVSELNVNDVEKVLKDNVPQGIAGVKMDLVYDEKIQEVVQTIEVNVDKLGEEDYAKFGIPQNRGAARFISNQEASRYVCKEKR